MEEEKQEKSWCEELQSQIEEKIKNVVNESINVNNADYLYKLVDIHKDLANENYWKEKIEMMYRNYGRENYGEYEEGSYGRRGVPGSGRRRYRESGYGRRGVDAKYRGQEMMDEMMYHYGNYSDGQEQYGADEETMKSFKYMLKAFKDYYKHLKKEATSQQEVQMLEDTAREISEM